MIALPFIIVYRTRISRISGLVWFVGTTYFAMLLPPAIIPFGLVGNSHLSHIAQLVIIASLEGAFIGAAFAAAFFVSRRIGLPPMLTLPVA